MSKLADLISQQAEMKRQFQAQAQELFKGMTKEFFDKNPGITAVTWVQYTPYFNDGEPCVFSVGDVSFTNASDPEDINYGEYEGEEEGAWAATNLTHVMNSDREWYRETREAILAAGGVDVESCDELSNAIMSSEMEDVMLAMFGDHARIIATREGFTVDEYEHD